MKDKLKQTVYNMHSITELSPHDVDTAPEGGCKLPSLKYSHAVRLTGHIDTEISGHHIGDDIFKYVTVKDN